jgi:hypothetical protein
MTSEEMLSFLGMDNQIDKRPAPPLRALCAKGWETEALTRQLRPSKPHLAPVGEVDVFGVRNQSSAMDFDAMSGTSRWHRPRRSPHLRAERWIGAWQAVRWTCFCVAWAFRICELDNGYGAELSDTTEAAQTATSQRSLPPPDIISEISIATIANHRPTKTPASHRRSKRYAEQVRRQPNTSDFSILKVNE